MIFNHFVNLYIIFWGIFHFFGCIGGLLFWGALIWLCCTRRGAAAREGLRLDDEYRCRQCQAADYCDAAYSGVVYPCSHYREKEDKP